MRKSIIALALVAILAGAGVIYWGAVAAPSMIASLVKEANRDFSVPAVAKNLISPAGIKKYNGQPLEYLGRPEVVAKYPKNFVAKQSTMLKGLIEGVDKNPNQADQWIEIGLIKKGFDNYLGARDVWEYVSLINSQYALNYFNLGNLYGFYLGNLKKAEADYLKAISLSRTSVDFYLGLASFYRDAYREKQNLIDDVLLSGLKNIPNDPNLMIQLAYYYKSVGDKEGALKYFTQLLKSPNISGTQQQDFQEEIQNISK